MRVSHALVFCYHHVTPVGLNDWWDSHFPIIMSPLRGWGYRRELSLSIIMSPLRGLRNWWDSHFQIYEDRRVKWSRMLMLFQPLLPLFQTLNESSSRAGDKPSLPGSNLYAAEIFIQSTHVYKRIYPDVYGFHWASATFCVGLCSEFRTIA